MLSSKTYMPNVGQRSYGVSSSPALIIRIRLVPRDTWTTWAPFPFRNSGRGKRIGDCGWRKRTHQCCSVQFSSVAQLCLTLCDTMICSMPGLPVHHQLPEFTQTHAHWLSDAIQPSHALWSFSPPTFNLSQHQGLFQWVSSLHQVAKILEFQLLHQSFQWIIRTGSL